MEDKKIYKRIVVNLLLTITAVVLCVLFLGDLLRFFLPFVIGTLNPGTRPVLTMQLYSS